MDPLPGEKKDAPLLGMTDRVASSVLAGGLGGRAVGVGLAELAVEALDLQDTLHRLRQLARGRDGLFFGSDRHVGIRMVDGGLDPPGEGAMLEKDFDDGFSHVRGLSYGATSPQKEFLRGAPGSSRL
jgi:hypothetical protein